MEENQKLSTTLYRIVFYIVVLFLSLLSGISFLSFSYGDKADTNEWTAELGNKFETDQASGFFMKYQFVNINGAVRRILGQREMNEVVRLDNGYLTIPVAKTSDETLQTYAGRVNALSGYLQEREIPIVYAATPATTAKYDPQLPVGVEDFANDNTDRFLSYLNQETTDVIDFREEMYADGIDPYEMMYKTDHHWTTKAGLYAYGKLENYLTNTLDCEVDSRIADIDNYTVTTYPAWHLGSRGQRCGKYFGGIDDFDLIVPNFPTTLICGDKTGSMEDLIFDRTPLQNKDYSTRYTYDHVLAHSLEDYQNPASLNDKKILLLTDSFGRVVNPYLIMAFKEVRHLSSYDSNLLTKEYLDAYDPDAVIILYYNETLTEDDYAFRFEEF